MAKYVPLTQTYPAFADAKADFPSGLDASGIPPELWGILERAEAFSVRQHVKLLPKACCACPPCVRQENTYSIYAGMTRDNQSEILRADEVSDDWNRCCCAPFHPLRLELRQYIPVPGDNASSDWSHLTQDFSKDFSGLTGGRKAEALKNLYLEKPPLISMVRVGGQRCCCKFPCKWLNTFVCFDCCTDGLEVYSGAVDDEKDGEGKPKEVGRPFNLPVNRLIASALQPIYAGYFTPTIHLRTGQSKDQDPFAKIEGPFCFGGWSEMCCDFKFYTSFFASETKKGDVALITKQKPGSVGMAITELMSNSDNYSIQFNLNPQRKLTAAEKASVVAGQILADYMYFDGSTEKCSEDENAVYCNLWYCSCIGCLWPCSIIIPKNKGESS